MSDKTKIEWADATWNPVTGCTPVSPGCENCYAARMAKRFPHLHSCAGPDDRPYFNRIVNHIGRLDIPSHWRKSKRIFVCSMGDLFHDKVNQNFRFEIYNVMRNCPQHTFMVLTKRPENISSFYNHLEYECNLNPVLPNLWLGVTAENQEHADRRIPILLQIPAAKRFVSVEPMLEDIDLTYPLNGGPEQNGYGEWTQTFQPLDWVICGPETGPGARLMNIDWARSLLDQCVAARVPFFYKRGELDGKLWHQFPVSK
jgi:protein gp37